MVSFLPQPPEARAHEPKVSDDSPRASVWPGQRSSLAFPPHLRGLVLGLIIAPLGTAVHSQGWVGVGPQQVRTAGDRAGCGESTDGGDSSCVCVWPSELGTFR